MKKWLQAIAAATVLAWAHAAAAQSSGAVQTHLEARKVERAADGRERLAPAEAARPGDVIQYTATYRNNGTRAVRDLEATLPIPANTEYVAGSARPQGAKASVDAAGFAAMPLTRRVVRDGKEVEEPVPLREYRYLRWHAAELGAGASLEFTARVKVVDEGAGAPGSGK